jgi:DNA polymerase-3 subunit delta'
MLLGFQLIKSNLSGFYQNQKLPHAILLHGQKGIGKASFAADFAREILGSSNKSSVHPDLLIIEKEPEKKEVTVNKSRKITEFCNQTPAISKSKFIIIDAACELNKAAANALLKILEEPQPGNFFILISHNLNHILPTIRSRCQIIRVPGLSSEDFMAILHQRNPEFTTQNLLFLKEICDNSPAEAINFGFELTEIYALFLESIAANKINEKLLNKISAKNFSFTIFEKSYEFFISRLLKSSKTSLSAFYFTEKKIFLSLQKKIVPEKIFMIADETLNLLRKAVLFNLDKKLILINIFNLLRTYTKT